MERQARQESKKEETPYMSEITHTWLTLFKAKMIPGETQNLASR
jgi:hypothetical protein